MTSNARASEDPAARPRRSWRGRLVVGAFGLLGGAVAALVALAPTLANDHGSELAEDWFAARFRGRLDLGEITLAWFRPGAIDGLVLSDPDGVEVASGSLALPSVRDLVPALFGRVGSLRARLDVALVRDREGRTNLERALERRDGGAHADLVRGDLELALAIEGERWAVRDQASGRALELEQVEASLVVAPDEPIVLRGSGRERSGARVDFGADVFAAPDVAFAPQRIELALDADGVSPAAWLGRPAAPERVACSLRGLLAPDARTLDLTVRGDGLDVGLGVRIAAAPFDLPGLPASDDGSWDVELDARGTLPSRLVDVGLGLDGWVAGVLGPSITVALDANARGTGAADARVPLTVGVRAGVARIDWSGRIDARRLRAGGDDGLTATLVWSPAVRDRLVRPLMPLARGLERDPSAGPLTLRLREVDCGLPLALDDVTAELELALGSLTFGLPPALADELGLDRALTLPGSDPVELRLERGVAHYPGLRLELDGQRLPLSGRYDLTSRAVELAGSLPAALVTTKLVERLGPLASLLGSAVRLDFTIGGTEERPLLRLHPPEVGGGLFGGGLRDVLETSLPPK